MLFAFAALSSLLHRFFCYSSYYLVPSSSNLHRVNLFKPIIFYFLFSKTYPWSLIYLPQFSILESVSEFRERPTHLIKASIRFSIRRLSEVWIFFNFSKWVLSLCSDYADFRTQIKLDQYIVFFLYSNSIAETLWIKDLFMIDFWILNRYMVWCKIQLVSFVFVLFFF